MFLRSNLVAALGLALSGVASAALTSGFTDARQYDSQGAKATCVTGSVSMQVTSPNNIMLNTQLPPDDVTLTQSLVSLISSGIGQKLTEKIVGQTHSVTENVTISATMCVPKSGYDRSKAVQVLTHGIGFDHAYWDFAPGYSYVDVAAQSGAATFSYDRLGVGLSSTPDPIQVVQGPMEVAVKHELITMLKNGDFSDMRFSKAVAVGHSFGSIISNALTASFPSDVDGVVLTGFTLNSSGVPIFQTALNAAIARTHDPLRFPHLNNGYLISNDLQSTQINFFHSPGFVKENLYQAELSKQTVTIGELLTLSETIKPAPKFTGVVDVVNAAFDIPFCLGNCRYPVDLSLAVPKMLYPKASKSATYLAANSGHGINLHKVAPQAFNQIQTFLKQNNL